MTEPRPTSLFLGLPTRWAVPVAAVLLVGGGLAVATLMSGNGPRVTQPVAFNHQRHLAEELTCTDCHLQADKGPHATLPKVKQCLLCHSEAKGEHPDEPKIREYAERGEEIPWVQVNRLPGHVYFSHVAHVARAKMDCTDCHAGMKERTEPVTASQIDHLDMDACLDCHREKGVSEDCLRCHK